MSQEMNKFSRPQEQQNIYQQYEQDGQKEQMQINLSSAVNIENDSQEQKRNISATQDQISAQKGQNDGHQIEDIHLDMGLQIQFRQSDAPFNGNGRFNGEEELSGVNFQQTFCHGSACVSIRRFFNWIGSVIAVFGAAVDIAYVAKSPFFMKPIFYLSILFICLRFFSAFALGQYYYTKFVRNYKPNLSSTVENKMVADENEDETNENGQNQSRKYIETTKQGTLLYSMMHILFFTGFYRHLPSLDFPGELGFGFCSEFFFSTIPLLLLWVFNNAQLVTPVLPIQSAALLLKLFSFLLFIVELIFAIWEYLNNKKLKKYKIKGFQKKSEEERRHRYANLVGMYSLVSSLIFICILILTLVTTPNRQCQDRAALEQAVCTYCEDQNCAVCDQDHEICTSCDNHFYPDASGSCTPCSSNSKQCLSCSFNQQTQRSQCNNCDQGYYVNSNGVCQSCNQNLTQQTCLSCSSPTQCLQCDSRFSLTNGQCLNCLYDLPNCVQCSGPGQCTQCNTNVASLDSNSQCTICNSLNGWTLNSTTRKCQCNNQNFVNAYNGSKCQQCSDLLPNCAQCAYISSPNPGDYYAFVGYDQSISVSSAKQYVNCTQKIQAQVQITPRQAPSNPVVAIPAPVDPVLPVTPNQPIIIRKSCSQLFEGCSQCNSDFSQCSTCRSGYYLYTSGNIQICGSCGNQDLFGPCNQCSTMGCSQCKDGNFKLGFKCYRKFWSW